MSETVINIKGRKPQTIRRGELYIGRDMHRGGWALHKSPWYCPYRVTTAKSKGDGTRDEVMRKFRAYMLRNKELLARLPELRGKTLACWCKPKKCHGDILLELLHKRG